MLKVFLIGFLCVALTRQSSIGDSLKGGLENAQDQASSLRQKRQFEIVSDMMSK